MSTGEILCRDGRCIYCRQKVVTDEKEQSLKKEFVKHDSLKNPLHLLPTVALERVGEVLDFGQKKYAAHGWRKVDKRSRYYAAVLRHCFAWWRGEEKDPDSGLSHLAHAACSLLFLLEAHTTGLGEDDRPIKPQRPEQEPTT